MEKNLYITKDSDGAVYAWGTLPVKMKIHGKIFWMGAKSGVTHRDYLGNANRGDKLALFPAPKNCNNLLEITLTWK